MGQQNPTGNNNLLTNWQQHPLEPNILYNMTTNQQVHRHFVTIKDPNQLRCYSTRMYEHSTYICRVVYYHPSLQGLYQTFPKSFYVYTDRMVAITQWRHDSALAIMKGFKKLMNSYQPFRVQKGMIGQNQRGQIKIWINSNPIVNFPQNQAKNQEQMLADITGIIMLYDKHSVSSLIGCRNFFDAIKKLSNKSEDQQTVNYSYRVHQYADETIQGNKGNKNKNIPYNNYTNDSLNIRSINDERSFNSQGKQRNSPSQYELPSRNANSSAKHVQAGLGKNEYQHIPLIPSNFNYTKVGSPRIKMQKDNINDNIDKVIKGSNHNSSMNVNKYAFAYRNKNKQTNKQGNKQHERNKFIKKATLQENLYKNQDQRKFLENAQENYTSQFQQKNRYEKAPKYEYISPPHNQISNKKKNGVYRASNYEKNERIQTFNNVNQLLEYDEIRNKTNQVDKLKNNIPSFIPRKKQNQLCDNISQDGKSSQQLVFDYNFNKVLEKKISGKFLLKAQQKIDKIKENTSEKGEKLFKKIQKQQKYGDQIYIEREKRQLEQKNYQKYKKQALSPGIQYNGQGHTRYGSNQQTYKKKNNEEIPPVMSQSGGQQGAKKTTKVGVKAQSMDNSSLIDDESKKNINLDTETKKKYKEEMARQLKKQFGEVLFNNYDENEPKAKQSYEKAKNTQKYLEMKLDSMNKAKANKYEHDQKNDDKSNDKLQNIISKYAENVKDQLIKQKVEKKKATFAELKIEAMKILSDDLN